jgi:hypothetical protein
MRAPVAWKILAKEVNKGRNKNASDANATANMHITTSEPKPISILGLEWIQFAGDNVHSLHREMGEYVPPIESDLYRDKAPAALTT